jgi:hypothetical protein
MQHTPEISLSPSSAIRRRSFVQALAPLVAAPTAALVAACGANAPAPARQEKAAATVEFFDWWLPTQSPLQDAWFKFVRQDFEAKHPGVTIEFSFIDGSSAVRDKLHPTIVADTPPDASHLSMIFARAMWDAGMLEEMSPYVAKTADVAIRAVRRHERGRWSRIRQDDQRGDWRTRRPGPIGGADQPHPGRRTQVTHSR